MLELLNKAYKVYQAHGLQEVLKRFFHRLTYFRHWLQGRVVTEYIGHACVRMHVPTYHDFTVIDYVARTEQPLREAILSHIEENDVFWDVGANVGLYACAVGKLGRNIRVVAFEPNPIALSRLEANVALNKLKNVQIVNVALWERDGELPFDIVWTDNVSPHGRVIPLAEPDEEKNTVYVQVMRGDSLIRNGIVLPPNVLKVDVEGAEVEVLRGVAEALRTCRVALIEVHPPKGGDRGQIEGLLIQAGFRLEEIGRRGSEIWIKGVNYHIGVGAHHD